jgi:predicted LPLAT superfamily acyltransferase
MAEDWRNQSERSTPFMLKVIVFLASHVRRAYVRPLLYPIVAYFLISSPRSRAISSDYLRRALGRRATWRDLWKHFFAFASCTLDRIFLLSKNHAQIRVDASWTAGIAPIVASGRGCLLIVAHFGSTEVLRFTPTPSFARWNSRPDSADTPLQISDFVTSRANHVKTTILMDRRHGRMLLQLLERLNPEMAVDIVDAAERGPSLVLRLKESLEAGRMVCLMADRVTDEESFAVVDFLGSPARFAATPWILANALRAPVILGFGVYRGGNRYSSHFELFSENVSLPRDGRAQAIAAVAQRYAARLEHYARTAPYNWFNFYDYWLTSERQPTKS